MGACEEGPACYRRVAEEVRPDGAARASGAGTPFSGRIISRKLSSMILRTVRVNGPLTAYH